MKDRFLRASYAIDDIGECTREVISDLNGSLRSWNFYTLWMKDRFFYFHDVKCPLFLLSRRNFLEIPRKYWYYTALYFWCSRFLVVWKMHLRLGRLPPQILQRLLFQTTNKLSSFSKSWRGGNSDVIAQYASWFSNAVANWFHECFGCL